LEGIHDGHYRNLLPGGDSKYICRQEKAMQSKPGIMAGWTLIIEQVKQKNVFQQEDDNGQDRTGVA